MILLLYIIGCFLFTLYKCWGTISDFGAIVFLTVVGLIIYPFMAVGEIIMWIKNKTSNPTP